MEPKKITPKQKRLLDFIREFAEKRGYAPSQQEMADHFGYKSLGTIQNFLTRLESQGFMKREWNAKRSFMPVEPRPMGIELPLLGYVAAGRPIEAVDSPGTIEVPPAMLGRGENFVLKVKGDSMVGDGIMDGDYVIVAKRNTAENGATVVALVDGEATVKHFYRHPDRVVLKSANPLVKDIIVAADKEIRIEGIVVGVIRHL